jgi:hypothetical protein
MEFMRSKSLMLALLLFGAAAYAEEPKAYQSGELLQMDSVRCGGEKTQELLCQEYQLQTDKVVYRIRPREMKRPVLLPMGERAQFRFAKDKMLLRVEAVDGKEREYVVVSMKPRSDSTADASPVRLNHLQ